MAHRNFSMVDYFNRLAAEHEPELSFRGSTRDEWQAWHGAARARLEELLGPRPAKVDPAAEVVYSVEEDGLVRERIVLDTERHMSMPCVLLRAAGMRSDGSNPAILCSHGHGTFGKEPVAGNRTTAALRADIEQMNYDYAAQMARRGYVTLSPDLRVFGERGGGAAKSYPGRDQCNIHFLRGMILGVHTLALNVHDMGCAIDYLQTRPEVDPERIGMMGLSQGGTMTAFTTAVEDRIKAADVIGYAGSWRGFGIREGNFCGSQVVPGIFRYLDVSDVIGLASPRPLLMEAGVHDTCFRIDEMLPAARRVEGIYRAAGAGEHFHLEVHPGEHAFAGGQAFEFFDRFLKGSPAP